MISYNNGVKVFRCPGTKPFVHIYVGLWMMSIQWGVFQLDVELHLLVEDLISSISAEAYARLYLVWSDFSPSCSHFGRRVVYQVPPLFLTLYCRNIKLSDTFVISKCMWQICNVLQICDSKLLVQILWVRGYKDWMWITFLIYFLAFFVVLISP